MRWQVCIEDIASGILMARVHRGMTITRFTAIRRMNRINSQLNYARWDTVRAVIVPARETRHLIMWRITLTNRGIDLNREDSGRLGRR